MQHGYGTKSNNWSLLVDFGIKGMRHTFTFLSLLLHAVALHAQDIQFDQGNWQNNDQTYQRRLLTIKENMERVDSAYTENPVTGELQLQVHRYPLSRYEYHLSDDPFPPLRRRIDIRQVAISDTLFVENIETGNLEMVVQKFIRDIPNGAYQEFFPNGTIRIKGTLDGYNQDGTLKKMGTWMEWDAAGNVIREEHYP
jgi:hypothetical protein